LVAIVVFVIEEVFLYVVKELVQMLVLVRVKRRLLLIRRKHKAEVK
jgi:hypothetical protein